MKNSKWIAVALAAVIAGGAAMDALAGDGRRGRGGRGRRGAAREKFGRSARDRRQGVVKFLATLDITDEQRRIVLEKARAAAPVVETAKDEARRIVARAWASAARDPAIDRKSLKETTKAELVALREKTRASIEPLAKEVVASLTPEQRKKVEEAAAKHGRTVDEAKLVKFASRLISRPMTVAFLEARLGR
jgi:LTXXQ motif family protein